MKILLVDDEKSEHSNAGAWAKKISHIVAVAEKHSDVMQIIDRIVQDVHSDHTENENGEKKTNLIENLLDAVRQYDDANLGSVRSNAHENIFEVVSAKTITEAKEKMSDEIDIAIVDMKMDEDRDNGGEDIVNYITNLCLRIPVYIYSATTTDISVNYYIKITKGEKSFAHLLLDCYALHKTGIINIIKKRALIDKKLLEIFQNNLTISLRESNWLKYALKDSQKTEQALLRYTLNHMQQFLDEDKEEYYPEEVYIFPPIKKNLQTGCVVQCKKTKRYLLVVSPACDLANNKTERIQLLEIENLEETIDNRCKKNKDNQDRLKNNTFSLFYHYLPKTGFFPGGFINFRLIHSVKPRQMKKFFSEPILQISASFCKDVVSRFSSYYARQGQPLIKEIL